MATMLRRLKLSRVSLVDNPANLGAQVLLFKSAEGFDGCEFCKAEQSSEARGNLSDADFAAVWTDAEGRKQRKLPIHDAAHVRNALARWNQTDLPADVKAKARAKLEAKAKELGIGDYAKQQPTSSEVNVPGMPKCPKCDAEMKKGDAKCSKCGAMMPDMEPDADDMAKVAKEKKAMDEKLKADLDAATAKLAETVAYADLLSAENDSLKNTPEEIEKRKLAALPESVRKRLEDGEAKIAKMEAEVSEREQTDFAKSALPQIPGKPEDVGKLLKRVKDVAKAEDFEALVTMLKAASAQIEKGQLFREVGVRGDGPTGDPMTQINALADAMVAKDAKLDRNSARDLVLREHPDLYEAYARSVTTGHKAASAADAN